MKAHQLILASKSRDLYLEEDYFVSQSNNLLYSNLIQNTWTHNCTILIGENNSGKTHLCNIWRKRIDGLFVENPSAIRHSTHNTNVIVENIERFASKDELASLLHFYNSVIENKKLLLLTTKDSTLSFSKKLPDLHSRLLASTHLTISIPDDSLLRVVIHKQFYLRQLQVNEKVVDLILNKVNRSIKSIIDFIDFIDVKCLHSKKEASLPNVSKYLREYFNSA